MPSPSDKGVVLRETISTAPHYIQELIAAQLQCGIDDIASHEDDEITAAIVALADLSAGLLALRSQSTPHRSNERVSRLQIDEERRTP